LLKTFERVITKPGKLNLADGGTNMNMAQRLTLWVALALMAIFAIGNTAP